jgi:hypothetical protein
MLRGVVVVILLELYDLPPPGPVHFASCLVQITGRNSKSGLSFRASFLDSEMGKNGYRNSILKSDFCRF